MATAVSISSASTNNSQNNYSSHSSDTSISDMSHFTLSTEAVTSIESDSTNHSIRPISISSKTPTVAPPPYHNPRYLGSIPFYYPPRNPAPTAIQNPYQSKTGASVATDPPDTDRPSQPTPTPPRRYHQTSIESCWDSFQSSCDNLKKNKAWGDDFQVKTSHSFRIYFQNVNSCSISTGTGKMDIIAKSMIQAECDFINLAQTSLNWRILPLRNRMKEVIQKHLPIHRLFTGNNKYESEQLTLPGGVAQVVRGDWTGRIVKYIHDFRRMDRWCRTKIRLKHDRHLYVICAYRVCEQSLSQIGVETAYGQQHYPMTLDNIQNTNPRKLFIDDLKQAIKQWQTNTDEVLIVLDANKQIGKSSHGLTSLMRDCKLVDLFHQHHGIQPDFSTYE